MPEGQYQVICLNSKCDEKLTYWQKETGVVFWNYDGNSAKKSMKLLRMYQAYLSREKKREKVKEPVVKLKPIDTVLVGGKPGPKPPPEPVLRPVPGLGVSW